MTYEEQHRCVPLAGVIAVFRTDVSEYQHINGKWYVKSADGTAYLLRDGRWRGRAAEVRNGDTLGYFNDKDEIIRAVKLSKGEDAAAKPLQPIGPLPPTLANIVVPE